MNKIHCYLAVDFIDLNKGRFQQEKHVFYLNLCRFPGHKEDTVGKASDFFKKGLKRHSPQAVKSYGDSAGFLTKKGQF